VKSYSNICTLAAGRNDVRWHSGQEASLVTPCSNLMSFGSKCTIEERRLAVILSQGRNEWWKTGEQFPGRRITMRAPNDCGGRQKDPTMSQVLSSIQNTCFRKTSGSNMGKQTCFLSRVPCTLATPLHYRDFSVTYAVIRRPSQRFGAPIVIQLPENCAPFAPTLLRPCTLANNLPVSDSVSYCLDQRSPNYGRRRNFLIDKKIIYCIYENLLIW